MIQYHCCTASVVTFSCLFPSCVQQTAPSVPRKLKAQWSMGIIQAKEAVHMPLDERMTKFTFVYDDNGPHLNPHVMEKLRPEPSSEKEQETKSRLSPSLLTPPGSPAADLLSQESTSAGKKIQARRTEFKIGGRRKMGKGQLIGSPSKKKLIGPGSSKAMPLLQPASQVCRTHTVYCIIQGRLV